MNMGAVFRALQVLAQRHLSDHVYRVLVVRIFHPFSTPFKLLSYASFLADTVLSLHPFVQSSPLILCCFCVHADKPSISKVRSCLLSGS